MPQQRHEDPWTRRATRGVGSIVGIGLLVLAGAAIVTQLVTWLMAVVG